MFVGLMCCAGALAEEGEPLEDNPVMAVAEAQASAEIALGKAAPIMDKNKSGWDKTWKSIDKIKTEIRGKIGRVPGEARRRESRADFTRKLAEAVRALGALKYAFGAVPSPMNYFKTAEADITDFVAVYEAIGKRAEEIGNDAEEAIAGLKETLAEWEAELERVKEFAAAAE